MCVIAFVSNASVWWALLLKILKMFGPGVYLGANLDNFDPEASFYQISGGFLAWKRASMVGVYFTLLVHVLGP